MVTFFNVAEKTHMFWSILPPRPPGASWVPWVPLGASWVSPGCPLGASWRRTKSFKNIPQMAPNEKVTFREKVEFAL